MSSWSAVPLDNTFLLMTAVDSEQASSHPLPDCCWCWELSNNNEKEKNHQFKNSGTDFIRLWSQLVIHLPLVMWWDTIYNLFLRCMCFELTSYRRPYGVSKWGRKKTLLNRWGHDNSQVICKRRSYTSDSYQAFHVHTRVRSRDVSIGILPMQGFLIMSQAQSFVVFCL